MVKTILAMIFGVSLLTSTAYGQSAGAVRTQEIYSSTGHVKVDNTIGTAVATVTFNASTTFNANLGNHFVETLTGNVTSSTLSNAATGEDYYLSICQDGTGSWTFSWPANFLNAPTVIATASKCTSVVGFYDGTNFRITGRWDTSGSTGGSGTVTSVGMTGDGVVFNSSVTGSPVTTSGTLAPTLANAPSGYVLAGPIGSAGTNVAVRQYAVCAVTNGAASQACSFPANNPVQSGSMLAVMISNYTGASGTATDTLGTTLTRGLSNSETYYTGITGSAGADTITANAATTFGATETMIIVEMVGVASLHLASAPTRATIGDTSKTVTITPSNATNGFLELSVYDGSSGSGQNATAITVNPQGSLVARFTTASSNLQGNIWTFGPQTTSAQNVVFSFPAGIPLNVGINFLIFDFVQSSSAGSGPWVARQLTEGDLPSSAKAAIQAVNRFVLSANVSLPSATDTSVVSGALTMPSDGCPCRVLVQYGMYLSSTTSATWDTWVSDGTNEMGHQESITTDAHTPPDNGSELSPVSYANSQSVTFTLHINPGTYAGGNTVQVLKTPAHGTELSWMTLTIMQSIN